MLRRIFGIISGVIFGLLLLIVGVVLLLYSGWAQEMAREAVVAKMGNNPGGMEIRLDKFSLRFPLDISLENLVLINQGDTMAAASSADISLSLLPLVKGEVGIDRAALRGAAYYMGAPDSAMWLRINADSLGISPASVALASMDISLDEAAIRGGRMYLQLNPDTTPPTPPAPPTDMRFSLGTITLEDFEYSMRMMPTIDTLSAVIPHAELRGGTVDLYMQNIALGKFLGTGLNARYIAPDSASIAAMGPIPTPAPVDSALLSPPWTVQIDTVGFDKSRGLYTTAGYRPTPGLDFGYIQASDMSVGVKNFYNRQTDVRVPLTLAATERCGVKLDATGVLDINATALDLRDFVVTTPEGTAINLQGLLGMGDMTTDPNLPVSLDTEAQLAPADLRMMFPAFLPYFAALPPDTPIEADVDLMGTMGNLKISELELRLNRCVNLSAEGSVLNVMNPELLGGHIALTGRIINLDRAKDAFLDPATAKTINIPPMTLAGNVEMSPGGSIDGKLMARTVKNGELRLKALWNSKMESYDASVDARSFPVEAFMPLLGVGALTGTVDVKGRGYDPFLATTQMNARADIASASYQGTTYRNIKADAELSDGNAKVNLVSANTALDLDLTASGNLSGDTYRWTATLNGNNIDLQTLGFSTTPSTVETTLRAEAEIGPGKNNINATVTVDDLFLHQEKGTIGINDVVARFAASDSAVTASIDNRDLKANFNSPSPLDTLLSRFDGVSTLIAAQLQQRDIEIDTLRRSLPQFSFNLEGGNSNFINDVLRPSDMSLQNIRLKARNDSTLSMNGRVLSFKSGTTRIDTLYLFGGQYNNHLHLVAGMGNRPGTMDALARVWLHATVDGNEAHLNLRQRNVKGDVGFRLGFKALMEDSALTVSIDPLKPIIGYQQWEANEGNFIEYFFPTGHIDANLKMTGGKSALQIYTAESGADEHDHSHEHSHDVQDDLVIKLSDIHLSDWISLNPFAPPVKGDLAADMRLNRAQGMIMGMGDVSLTNFYYGRQKAADIAAVFNVAAAQGGQINAHASLDIDGQKVMDLSGALNDSTATSPLAMDLSIIHLPLGAANPFLPASLGKLSGTLNGSMEVSGTSDNPKLNGWMAFDSTAVNLAMTGTAYRFNDVKIPVDDSRLSFNNFAIYGTNDNPLNVNGTVDISSFSNPSLDLHLGADNMGLVNTSRARKGADVYGKAFISLDASAKGNMDFIAVDAKLRVLPETNVTYVIPDATTEIASYTGGGDLVKFVNFTDSAAMAQADSISEQSMAMLLDALLTIEDGSTISVDLNTDGKNKASLESTGTLNFTMSPATQSRLTGRLNINGGFVRYTPPFMSEKYFTFNEGSYVSFTGDLMNPTLNVHAVDVVKANVTQEGQNSRLVDFDVSLGVTGTLANMNVAFDLATNDDITVANELQTMSPEQRANQAMNLLLYNVYTGPGTRGNASLSGNPLFSFLESQINSWAANTIKGVDVSFGINQYDKTTNGTTASTMSYSYQVSKSLFNDRFKIVVGGNYSTDANADENFSQNLISDVSLEYFLNNTRTMYIRIFRHTGFESILEGEVTQTGVGFVYRRKILRLADLFRKPKSRSAQNEK